MKRTQCRRSVVTLAIVMVFAAMFGVAASVAAAQGPARNYAGRRLADVLRELQRGGLRIVFSSELVRPEMTVSVEPTAKDPRARLEEVLRPFGLGTQAGQQGTLLVVRRALVPPEGRTAPIPQTGTIRGIVVDATTGVPLDGVVVQVVGTSLSVRSSAQGVFVLEGVAAGRQTLYVSLIGYSLVRPSVEVRRGETAEIRIALPGGTTAYNEALTVRPEQPSRLDMSVPALQRLGNAEIQTLRGVLADDPIRAVQALPGRCRE
jgi:Carboxypeptidase regulatory-like domain